MIEVGKTQTLIIKKKTRSGAILSERDKKGTEVIMYKEDLPRKYKLGDELDVFVYRGNHGEYLGTLEKPHLEVGELGALHVAAVTEIGTFLDLGIDRDVLLPHSETIGHPEEGEPVYVKLYLDKSNRLAATMSVKQELSNKSPYKKNDIVKGTIYSSSPKLGYLIAVDDKYDALLPRNEVRQIYEVGDEDKFRVTQVLKDGKMNLSSVLSPKNTLPPDAKRLLSLLIHHGRLPIGDKSDPKHIYRYTKMSKSAFKRAAGNLYRAGEANIGDRWIALKKKR